MYFKKGKAIKMLSRCGSEVLWGHVAEGDPAVPTHLAAHVQMWQKGHLAPDCFGSLQGHHCTWWGHWPWFTFPPLSSLAGNTRGSGCRQRHFSPFWAPGTLGQGVVFLAGSSRTFCLSVWDCTGKPRPHVYYSVLEGHTTTCPVPPLLHTKPKSAPLECKHSPSNLPPRREGVKAWQEVDQPQVHPSSSQKSSWPGLHLASWPYSSRRTSVGCLFIFSLGTLWPGASPWGPSTWCWVPAWAWPGQAYSGAEPVTSEMVCISTPSQPWAWSTGWSAELQLWGAATGGCCCRQWLEDTSSGRGLGVWFIQLRMRSVPSSQMPSSMMVQKQKGTWVFGKRRKDSQPWF